MDQEVDQDGSCCQQETSTQQESSQNQSSRRYVIDGFDTVKIGDTTKKRCVKNNCNAIYSENTSLSILKKHTKKHLEPFQQQKHQLSNSPAVDAAIKFIVMEQSEYSAIESKYLIDLIVKCCGKPEKIRTKISELIVQQIEPLRTLVKEN